MKEVNGLDGLLIAFEGPDGSGKHSRALHAQSLIQEMSKYVDVTMTHEPWHSAEIKRKLANDGDAYSDGLLMAELYVDDRVKHTKHLLRPVLLAGGVVLLDRYKMSTLAYQWAQGIRLHSLMELHEDRGILTPDLTFLLDIDPETAKKRIALRGQALEKFEKNEEYVKKVISAYRSLGHMAQVDPSIFGKVVVIDANKPHEAVDQEVEKLLTPLFHRYLQKNSSVSASARPATTTSG